MLVFRAEINKGVSSACQCILLSTLLSKGIPDVMTTKMQQKVKPDLDLFGTLKIKIKFQTVQIVEIQMKQVSVAHNT